MPMSSSPLYLQIAQQLASEIAAGIYPVGSNLPTEADICSKHEVSRFTAREALRCLVDRGMIQRRVRIGSQVISTTPVTDYQPVAVNTNDLVALATDTYIDAGQGRTLVADEQLSQRVGCDDGAELFVFEGPRFRRGAADTPMCWSEQYLTGAWGASARKKMVEGSFTADAAAQARIEQVVVADTLNRDLAQKLMAEAGSAALVIIRKHFNLDDSFRAASVQIHPADRYQLHIPVAGTASAEDMEAAYA